MLGSTVPPTPVTKEKEEAKKSHPETISKTGGSSAKTMEAPKTHEPTNSKKLGIRHIILLLEMCSLTLSVIFIENMLVPALPMIITRYSELLL